MDRFQPLGDLGDLEKAIEYESRALALTPDGHPRLPGRFANLGSSHSYRFKHLGDLTDLEKAIEYHSRALVLTSDGHPNLSIHLANLSASHIHRFERLGNLNDLTKAIDYGSRALASTPDDHPGLLSRLSHLGAAHVYRFQYQEKLEDLEKGIDYGSRALKSTPNDHPDLPKHLANLAMSYKHRFPCLGNLDDLEKAIEYESRALTEIGDNHPNSCNWYFNHATSYLVYYIYSENPLHLEESLRLFRISSESLVGSPRDRFRHAHKWATSASKYPALNPIEAYQTAIDILPQSIWLGATTDQRYKDLKMVETLPIDAAHAAILSSNFSLALEWLEHTRCIVWNQNLMLRSPLDQLRDSHPTLAAHLRTVAKDLQSASSESRESRALSSGPMSPEKVGQIHRRLATEYNELLCQIHALSGFEDFLRPMKVNGLLGAARNGPIVVINCHIKRSDAILILPNKSTVTHLPLPNFSREKAQTARSKIESSLRRLGLRERGVRPRREPGDKDDFTSALAVLWDDIVKPIVEFLEYTTDVTSEKLPHITWCPTGPLSFLPLHAAGDYNQLGPNSPSTLNCGSRVLIVGQATTPGLSPLPGTTKELGCVKSHVENKVGYSQLTDAEATPSTVLDAMEKHDWVHLACHAHQNVYDPTRSGFFLHGETEGTEATLDLAAINRRSFKKKGLAFLSACQTATGDETLPDEAVHLASGMLMAGYSSVIATMWSVVDEDAPLVADQVYGELIMEGKLGNGEAGRALHNAVTRLREKVGEKEFGRWVPYIHIGS
ncbi:aromatic di-alanine and TPR containing protein, partial [Rhizoctonia solani AG-3 Rhs1AP]